VDLLELGPLREASVTIMLRRTLGEEPDPRFTAACHRATAGNPLALRSVTRDLEARGVRPYRAQISRSWAALAPRPAWDAEDQIGGAGGGPLRVQIDRFLASVACRLGAGPCRLLSAPRATTLLAWRRLADGTKQILSCDPRAR
jgi:hypothetical protein